jgi:Cu2+-exporting ATPase
MDLIQRNAQICFHCGQPVPDGVALSTAVDGIARPMCCRGCQAAAQTIVACGLDRFYRLRTGGGTRPEAVETGVARFAAFDDETLQRRFVGAARGGYAEAALLLDGITCAACCWLIERRLGALPGMDAASVNYAARTARVRWDPGRLRFSAILAAVAGLGYHAAPYDADAAERQLARERNAQLRRIGIAGLFGMQIMMLSLGLYLGADAGVDAGLASLLRWSAALLALPVLLYSAAPFFRGALRDIATRAPGMDVPVALGIAIAFAGSLHALVTERGYVYFDSIAMFVFILLCGRFVEFSVRRRAAAQWDRLQRIQPAVATRLRERGAGFAPDEEIVPVTALVVGDRVRVRPGETVPADGIVVAGESSVSEALLSGESKPLRRGVGAEVVGGSINVETPLTVSVTRVSGESRLAQIARLAQEAELARPSAQTLSSRIASRFIVRLLIVAAVVALYWAWRDPSRWVPITVSVLVITCPCALALATPAALAAATGTLLRLGLLVRRTQAVETLGRATLFVFDKTGTLTRGELALRETRVSGGIDARAAITIAAALEAGSQHPVARALHAAAAPQEVPAATGIRACAGEGVEGCVAGRLYHLGSAAFIARRTGTAVPSVDDTAADTPVWLATGDAVIACFLLRDAMRDGARALVDCLVRSGCSVRLLSGDAPSAVAAAAAELGSDGAEGGVLPAGKVERLQRWRGEGDVICMLGDGVNDAPVLAAADVSVAMGRGADLARASADIILLDGRLPALQHGFGVARRALAVMRQNVAWAIAYNIVAVPLAATGLVTPWMAALGMSLSSLLVVLNAARLGHPPQGGA